MRVYILEAGCYENRAVAGVFDTPERAMAQAGGKWTRETTVINGQPSVSWHNDMDWDDAASVWETPITSTGPERSVDATRVQVYRPLDGGWAYLAESPDVLQLALDADVVLRCHRERRVWREPEPTDVDRRIAALQRPVSVQSAARSAVSPDAPEADGADSVRESGGDDRIRTDE